MNALRDCLATVLRQSSCCRVFQTRTFPTAAMSEENSTPHSSPTPREMEEGVNREDSPAKQRSDDTPPVDNEGRDRTPPPDKETERTPPPNERDGPPGPASERTPPPNERDNPPRPASERTQPPNEGNSVDESERQRSHSRETTAENRGLFGFLSRPLDYIRSFSTNPPRDYKYWENMPLEDKRRAYTCGSHYVTLDQIPTWQDHLGSTPDPSSLASKISLWRGDITRLEIDAIVNAANSSLLGGGGVDGAIHRAASRSLLEECRQLNGCNAGETKITHGHRMPAKYILHTVGPMNRNRSTLISCYDTCLSLVEQNQLRSVAFSCVSTGIYGYPNEDAAHVALRRVSDWLEGNADKVDRIIFCVFLKIDERIYQRLIPQYFPSGDEPHSPGSTGNDDSMEPTVGGASGQPSLTRSHTEPAGAHRSLTQEVGGEDSSPIKQEVGGANQGTNEQKVGGVTDEDMPKEPPNDSSVGVVKDPLVTEDSQTDRGSVEGEGGEVSMDTSTSPPQDSEQADSTGDREPVHLTGDGEQADLAGDGEQADLTGDGEQADLTGDGEQADLTGDGEQADLTGDGEQADLTGDGEQADLTGDGEQANSSQKPKNKRLRTEED